MTLGKIPTWDNMPEPEPLLVKSWEDFFPSAQQITQKKWNRDPKQDEIKDIFESLDEFDCENGTYWASVEYAVELFYDQVEN